jgi:hypothetical protein
VVEYDQKHRGDAQCFDGGKPRRWRPTRYRAG